MNKKKLLENEKLKAVLAMKLFHLVGIINPKRNELVWFSMHNECKNECKSELKNKKPMEITEETRIKDLIPEGYELDLKERNYPETGSKLQFVFNRSILIQIKKKEVKDFKYYTVKYFCCEFERFGHHDIRVIKCNNEIDYNHIASEKYLESSFESKIGLLKFICDDLGVNIEAFILAKSFGEGESYAKVKNICPPKFIESIFK